ncbi:MAG: C4-type zinc ribbon domain-containing protein [Anaerolineales bacterium]|nr:C4-type zinc ribbon domain-containing protein [Anaerolineales bacterium]
MSTVLHLYRLQQVDSQIDKTQRRLDEIQAILSNNQEMRQAQAILARAEQALTAAQQHLQQAEAQVGSQRIKIEQTESMLYSGNIKNPKEVQDLQNKSLSLKKHLGTLEDRQLEAMIAHDDIAETHKAAKTTLEKLTARLASEHQTLATEQTALTDEQMRLRAERDTVLPAIDAQALAIYEKLRQTKRGVAVTLMIDGGCSACGATLTPSRQQDIRSSNQFVYCSSCKRIVYGT